VKEALTDEKWIDDIRVELPIEALMEYLELWDIISNVELHEGSQDKHNMREYGRVLHHQQIKKWALGISNVELPI
jgi:hypothetical protein